MSSECKTLIVITGPTASGKSALAVDIARRLHTDVVSADSRQVYGDIPIVTAQPSAEEMQGVRHHLIGHLSLHDYYSAARFEEDAMGLLPEIFGRSDYAVVCGGSMLYIDALCYGIDELPTVPDALRRSLQELHRLKGDEWLLDRLRLLDPTTFSRIDRRNIKRVFHAVEISLTAGAPYSSLLTGEKCRRDFRIVKFLLDGPREELFERINSRVGAMVDAGLLDEARRVYPLRGLNSLNTVGLKELFAHFDGDVTLPEALARMAKNTRAYAKKQLTWLKRPVHEGSGIPLHTLPIGAPDLPERLLSLL